MKIFVSSILAVIIFLNTAAQTLDSTVKYIWKNKSTNIAASVEIYGLKQTNNSFCIFYLNGADTVYNNVSDSLFKTFVNISTLNCPIIKVNFYSVADSFPGKKIELYADEFSRFILYDVQKKYPQIETNNLIVAGVDYFAAVALFASINNPLKISKTALFINKNDDRTLLEDFSKADAKKLKGKVYLYINHQNKEEKFADFLANDLALNSSIVLYKFDHYSSIDSSKVFEEAYNWLMATGNNYIFRNDN